MATQTQKRRSALLAILLALLAAGTLCVLAIGAAGYTISSPLIDSIAAFFAGFGVTTSGSSDLVADTGGGGGGADDGGGGGSGGGSGGGGGGGGDGGQNNCLFGVFCINAGGGVGGDANTDNGQGGLNVDANTDNGQSSVDIDADATGNAGDNDADLNLAISGSVNDENTTCFLGLICFTAMADAAVSTDAADAVLNVDARRQTIQLGPDTPDEVVDWIIAQRQAAIEAPAAP